MQSKATTVEAYLAELPKDRRQAIEAVRQVIKTNMDQGYEEGMQYGMISYFVPHRLYPAGYHCDSKQPLPFVCLASQKNYMSLYMSCLYADETGGEWFRKEWQKTGKKMDIGKSCLRFKKVEDLALDVIALAIQRMPVRKHIEVYETFLATARSKAGASKKKPQPDGARKKAMAARKKPATRKKT